jgi:hypothetical protein
MLDKGQHKEVSAMRRAILTAAALTALTAVPLAAAAELTRDEYVARVEPICKRNTEANKRIFAGAKEQVRSGQLKAASAHFARAAVALDKTIRQLRAVPRPAADAAKLEKWIGYLEVESAYFERIGKALAKGEKGKAQTLSVRLNRNSNLANNSVLAFDFTYCKIDPSRFT